MTIRLGAVLAIGASLVGCSDDVDLTGVYQVDHAVSSMPCGADTPQAMPPAFFKLTKGDLFGTEYFTAQTCTDATATDCSGGGLFGGRTFTEPVDGGWRGVLTASFSGGATDTTCTLEYTESTALLDGAVLAIESTTHSEDVDNTDALCTAEEAERRNMAMPCVEHERIEATKL